MAADTVVANAQRAAGERTVMLDSEIKVKGFDRRSTCAKDGRARRRARPSRQYLAVVAGYLMSNEFRDAEIESVKMHLHHDDQLRTAKLLEASLVTPDKGRISPGDTVKVRTVLKPYPRRAVRRNVRREDPRRPAAGQRIPAHRQRLGHESDRLLARPARSAHARAGGRRAGAPPPVDRSDRRPLFDRRGSGHRRRLSAESPAVDARGGQQRHVQRRAGAR